MMIQKDTWKYPGPAQIGCFSFWMYVVLLVTILGHAHRPSLISAFKIEGLYTNQEYLDQYNELLKVTQGKDEFSSLATSSPIYPINGSCAPFPTWQLSALQDIYIATKGDQWNIYSDPNNRGKVNLGNAWNFDQPYPDPCGQLWFGLTCVVNECKLDTMLLIDSNLDGTLPESLGQLSSLTSLLITYNPDLGGQIPLSLGNMTHLRDLSISNCAITGTFPEQVFALYNLFQLKFYANHLTGTIPSMGWSESFPYLYSIQLSENALTGTIPSEWFQSTIITELRFYSNYLTGTIPSNINPISSLRTIDFSLNNLNGSLPNTLGNIKHLKSLILFLNNMTGTLPSSLGSLTSLTNLQLDTNNFTGTIPYSYINLKNIQYFYLFNNWLTGRLPPLGSKSPIIRLNIFNNYLTGTLPNNITLAGRMRSFDIHANFFSGTLPSILFKRSDMITMNVQNNLFSGTIPSLANMAQLQNVRFDRSYYTGSIPQGLGVAPSLQSANFSLNFLSGTVNGTDLSLTGTPSGLETIDFGNNFLTGIINNKFNHLLSLQRLLLSNNSFSGSIDQLLNFNLQTNVTTIDISANILTGTIPRSFFIQSNLSIFLASTNCIHGIMNDDMCNNKQWKIIVLNGLYTANVCRKLIFPSLPKRFNLTSYQLTNPASGTIPSCLFNLPKLQTLHLSGNAIGGTLDKTLIVTPTLTDLSLSHNQISGSVPSALLQHNWNNLDLSFNKFTGTIVSNVNNFTNGGTLKLEINHLSGLLPITWIHVPGMNILEGNLFACPNGKEELPQYDTHIDSYICASNNVDSSLFASLSGFLLLIVILCISLITVRNKQFRENNIINQFIYKCFRFIEIEFHLWWQIYNSKSSSLYFNQPIEHVYEFGAVMKEIRRWCIAIGIVMLTVLLPLYPLLSMRYGTYLYLYAWTVSASFMSGIVPAVIIFIVMILMLCGIFSIVFRNRWMNVYCLYERSSKKIFTIDNTDKVSNLNVSDTQVEPTETVNTTYRSHTGWYFAMIIGGLLNVGIVLFVNIGYILAVTGGAVSSDTQQVLSFVISLFNSQWNGTVMESFQRLLNRLRPLDKEDGELAVISFMVWMNLFNNIIVPCIAVAIISPDCFYYAFKQAPSVTASFGFYQCDGIVEASLVSANLPAFCEAEYLAAFVSAYDPPFTYSYQCSSSLLTAFADVIVYRFVMSGFVNPVLTIVFKYLHEEAFVRYGQASYPYKAIAMMVPGALIVLSDDALKRRKAKMAPLVAAGSKEDRDSVKVVEEVPPMESNDSTIKVDDEEEQRKEGVYEVTFKAKNVIIAYISDIAVLLTFGGIFPPIVFIGVFSICVNTVITQLILGRVVVLSRTQIVLKKSVVTINKKCEGVALLMVQSLLSLSLLLSIFWSFFVFDILGSDVGAIKAIWVFFVMAAIPGLIQLTNFAYRRYNSSLVLLREGPGMKDLNEKETKRVIDVADIELSDFVPSSDSQMTQRNEQENVNCVVISALH